MAITPLVAKATNRPREIEAEQEREIYEWRIYSLNGEDQRLDKFLQNVFIPAYNRKGVKVGAFKSIQKDNKRFVLLIHKNLMEYNRVRHEVMADKQFLSAAQSFYDSTAPNPAYSNFETYLGEAFHVWPALTKPDKKYKVFEFRVYHGPNEDANKRKIAMFENRDAINIFEKVGVHSVFYGNIMAGPQMPAMMYLTCFESVEQRNQAWDDFKATSQWAAMKKMPKYAYTATRNIKLLICSMEYSQI